MSTNQARLARLLTVLVALDAMLLSYEALARRATSIGIGSALPPLALPLGLIYPLALDGLLATAMLAAYVLRARDLRVRAYVWGVIAYGLGVSILGNALPPDTPPLVAELLRATPPISLALSLHLLILLNVEPRARRASRREPESEQPREQSPISPRATTVRVLPDPPPARTRTAVALELLAEAGEQGRSLSDDQLAEASGLSKSRARALLARASKEQRLAVDSR